MFANCQLTYYIGTNDCEKYLESVKNPCHLDKFEFQKIY